jgi:hypothetical protein
VRKKIRVIVGGFLGLLPAGGVTWDYLQYPLGFSELGCDAYYLEDTRLWPVYQTKGADVSDCSATVSHLSAVMDAFGMSNRWAYRDEASGECFGMSAARVRELCHTADVIVNVSCSTVMRDEYLRIPIRILIDSDPMFTQIQHQTQTGFTCGQSGLRELMDAHTHHFTFGENVGQPDCAMPSCGIDWLPTRQPICLQYWPVQADNDRGGLGFTTVMNWSAAPDLQFDGQLWGQKNVEFMKVISLPRRVPDMSLAIAVGQTTGEAFPADEARENGWTILDPHTVAGDWRSYQQLINRSTGEFSVAKQTYVQSNSGWFSCRSACYLAAGKPVVTQDTGWTTHLPHHCGLLGFSNTEQAAEALRSVVADPGGHARAARRVAEEFFDSKRVLSELLKRAGA